MAIVNHGIETGNAGAENSGQGFLLSLGAEGAEVKKWQEYLMSQGYGVSASGVFDKSTQIATRTWQMQNGLERTGSVNADAYALAGLKVGVAEEFDTSAGAETPEGGEDIPTEPEKIETAAPTTPSTPTTTLPFPFPSPSAPTTTTTTTTPTNNTLPFLPPSTPTTPTTQSSETEKKEEPQVPPQLRDPNPQLTEPTPTYGNDYVNGDSKAEDPAVKLPPQVVDPNPSLDKNQTTAPEDPRQNIPPQVVDPNPNLPKGDVQTPNNTPTTPTNGVASGAMAGAMAGAGTSSVPENNTPSNPPSKPTTDAPSDAPSYGKDYVNGDAEPTTPTTPTEPTTPAAPTETPSDQNEVDPNQYVGNTTDGGNGDPNAPDNNPTRDEAVKAPPMNYEEFLKSETETSGTSEVTKANDKETADVLAGLDQKANEGNNTPVKENLSESTTEASKGTTSSPANDGQEETPAVYGNTEEDYVTGTTMTWAEYFAQQENANSANSNESTNESGTTKEETTTDTPVDVNKLDPNQNEVDPNQYGGNTTDSGNRDPYASDNNPTREDSQYSDFVNEDSNEETSTDKPTEDTKTESKEDTSNADVLAGLAKIRDDGYKLAEDTKKNAEAAAIGAYERAITEAETEREKSVIDARNAAAQRRADYGVNAEALANMGLKSSGYSAYLDQQSYETERAETQAANALADYNKRMAGYAKEDADRIAAENYAKSIYDIDTTYQTNLLAADDRASAKDRQTASDFRTILADVGTGAYTKEQALQLARDLGLSEEQIRAIEGAADEYTASVENEKTEAENAAVSDRETIFKTEVLSNISFDTTNEALEEIKEIDDLTDEEYNRLVEKRNEEISQTLDKMIRQGDFANFEDTIEGLYQNEMISKEAYQQKWYEAYSKNAENIKSESDLTEFLNTLEESLGTRVSYDKRSQIFRDIIAKNGATVPIDVAYFGKEGLNINGTVYRINTTVAPDETIENLLQGAIYQNGTVVALFGRVYYKVNGGWRKVGHLYNGETEDIISALKTYNGRPTNHNNSTTVLDRETDYNKF